MYLLLFTNVRACTRRRKLLLHCGFRGIDKASMPSGATSSIATSLGGRTGIIRVKGCRILSLNGKANCLSLARRTNAVFGRLSACAVSVCCHMGRRTALSNTKFFL